MVPRPCGGRRFAAPSLDCCFPRAPTRTPPRPRQVTRSVKATPSYSAPRSCPQPRGCRGASAGQGAAARPSAALRHALRLAPHRGRGDADTCRDHAARAAKPAAERRGRRRAARGWKEGGRDSRASASGSATGKTSRGLACSPTPARSARGGSGSPPSCASAVPRASTIRPSATSPPRTRRRSTRATRAGPGPPPSRATGLWSEGALQPGRHAAVDGELGAGDVGGIVAGKEQRRLGDLLGQCRSAARACDPAAPSGCPGCLSAAPVSAVSTNPGASAFTRMSNGAYSTASPRVSAEHRALGRRIGGELAQPAMAHDRGDVDERAAASTPAAARSRRAPPARRRPG